MKPGAPESASSNDEWIAQYEQSHQHPVNRACHLIGIPMLTLAFPLALVIFFQPSFWPVPVGLYAGGWALQFIGHAFEGKPPEFLKDKRFFLVGLRWWFSKLSRRK